MKYALAAAAVLLISVLIIFLNAMNQDNTTRTDKHSCVLEFDVFAADDVPTNDLGDRALFSEVGAVDGTKIKPGERAQAAVITVAGLERLSLLDVVQQLIEGEAITTYWHIGSRVCVEREEDTDDRYIAHITGTHEYFTSERNVGVFSFAVVIDKKTGVIEVAGE